MKSMKTDVSDRNEKQPSFIVVFMGMLFLFCSALGLVFVFSVSDTQSCADMVIVSALCFVIGTVFTLYWFFASRKNMKR